MAQLRNVTTQPSNVGEIVRTIVSADPVLNLDDFITFIGYGDYRVRAVFSENTVAAQNRLYDLELLSRHVGSPATIPAGTVVTAFQDGVTQTPLSYNSTIFLNFKEDDYRDLLLSGDIVFAAQKHFKAKSVTVRIRNTSGTVSRNLSFPGSWIFIGSSGRPSTIGPSKTAILSVTCWGTSDADVIAVWGVQPG